MGNRLLEKAMLIILCSCKMWEKSWSLYKMRDSYWIPAFIAWLIILPSPSANPLSRFFSSWYTLSSQQNQTKLHHIVCVFVLKFADHKMFFSFFCSLQEIYDNFLLLLFSTSPFFYVIHWIWRSGWKPTYTSLYVKLDHLTQKRSVSMRLYFSRAATELSYAWVIR